ncbi:EVE domain-containing protein [bacterium]|nr:EVE domain-containing protein [bacterium]
MQYWLMKCEPGVYSISDLRRDGRTGWEGVRNYQARNYMKTMSVGDRAFFYHSNAEPSGIAGTITIVRAAYPDPFQFDPTHKYYDPKATHDAPIWVTVDIEFESEYPSIIPLSTLRSTPGLEKMEVLRKGSRLSIQPVTASEFKIILTSNLPR